LSFPESLINKRVPLTFMGERLFFDLSRALFSSFKVDDGSRLLLKSLARHGGLEARRSVEDVGCGVGVLGLAVKKRFPSISLRVLDRDALAVEMTRHNADLNGVELDRAVPSLMDSPVEVQSDLLVCNVPAKAGEPVHEAFLASFPSRVSPGGLAVLVIVSPLEESFRKMIEETGHRIVYEDRTANHLVLHLEPAPEVPIRNEKPSHVLGAAFRRHDSFTLNKKSYLMDTVYGLPDFDTPSFAVQTAAGLMAKAKPRGRLLCVNPGQGHLPARLAAEGELASVGLLSRDMLQLEAAARNLELNRPSLPRELFVLPGIWETPEPAIPWDWILLELDPVPGSPEALGFDRLAETLKPGGSLFVYGRSSQMHLFLKNLHGFTAGSSRKYRGCRAAVLRRT
jgi:Methyltransferase small domain